MSEIKLTKTRIRAGVWEGVLRGAPANMTLEVVLQGQLVANVTQTPIADMVAATRAHRSDVVALSFSAAFPPRQLVPVLGQLRDALPARVGLWAGGSGVHKLATARRPGVSGVAFGVALSEGLALLSNWTEKNPR